MMFADMEFAQSLLIYETIIKNISYISDFIEIETTEENNENAEFSQSSENRK